MIRFKTLQKTSFRVMVVATNIALESQIQSLLTLFECNFRCAFREPNLWKTLPQKSHNIDCEESRSLQIEINDLH